MILKFNGSIFNAAAWVMVIVAVMAAIFGERMMDLGTLSLELGHLTLNLTEDVQPDFGIMKIGIAAGLMIGGVICFLVSRGSKHLRGILAVMKEGRPFDSDASARLRKIAVLTLIGGFLIQVMEIAVDIVMLRAFPVEQILTSPVIANFEYLYDIDFGFVFLFCAILMLSYVFEYGQKLQLESDETL